MEHTWTWLGTSALLTPVFDIFQSHWISCLCPTRSYWPPLSAEKNSLSLSHLIPEIIWAKIGLIFHKNLSFDHFETFCTNILLDFRSYWPLFLVLRSFWPLIFTKPQILLGPFFHCVLEHCIALVVCGSCWFWLVALFSVIHSRSSKSAGWCTPAINGRLCGGFTTEVTLLSDPTSTNFYIRQLLLKPTPKSRPGRKLLAKWL